MKIFYLIALFVTSFAQSIYNSWNIYLLDNKVIRSLTPYNDITGFYKDGINYAIVGTRKNILIYEIVADSLKFLHSLAAKDTIAVHRDMKVYRNYLYTVAGEGNEQFRIYDLSLLPDSVRLVYSSSQYVKTGRNIFIDSVKGLLFVASCYDSLLNYYGLRVFSLYNPEHPVPFYEDTYLSVSDGYAKNGIVYLNCGNQGLWILNFQDTSNVKLIQSLQSYVNKGFCHSGMLSEDNKIYVFSDESLGAGVKVCSVNSDYSVNVESVVFSDTPAVGIPHNVFIRNRLAFVSYYTEGIQVFNVEDVRRPYKVGFFDSFPQDTTFHYSGNWGVFPAFPDSNIIVISDRQNGVFLLNISSLWKITNVKSMAETHIKIFPTISSEFINVIAPKNYEIRVFNLLGEEVLNTREHKINISHLPEGVYILLIKGKTFKFVKI